MINSDMAFDRIEDIARASGNQKQRMLKTADIKEYLAAAYNPYIKYHQTSKAMGLGKFVFTHNTLAILEMLSSRNLSGLDADSIVDTNISIMTPKSGELFKRILNKDLRFGMGAKTINKVFPNLIPTHDVMLAKIFEPKRVKFPCFGSPKIDGVRTIYKNGNFYSRNGHIYKGLKRLQKSLSSITDVLDGELIVKGKSFQEGSGLIRNGNFTPNAIFHIFDLPEHKGRFIDRLSILEDLNFIKFNVRAVIHKQLSGQNSILRFYQACRKAGYEGSVIKPFDYQYKGTRSYDWMKMKEVLSVDLRIMDIYEGEGKYTNRLGGVIVEYNGHKVRVGGGFSDFQRSSFWQKPDKIMFKTIEVLYMEETDKGSLRHPRFLGFREDKD